MTNIKKQTSFLRLAFFVAIKYKAYVYNLMKIYR